MEHQQLAAKLVSIHEPFIVFSLPCPVVEERVEWHPAMGNPQQYNCQSDSQ